MSESGRAGRTTSGQSAHLAASSATMGMSGPASPAPPFSLVRNLGVSPTDVWAAGDSSTTTSRGTFPFLHYDGQWQAHHRQGGQIPNFSVADRRLPRGVAGLAAL